MPEAAFLLPHLGRPASPPAASLADVPGHSWRCAIGPPDLSQHLVDVQTVNKCAKRHFLELGFQTSACLSGAVSANVNSIWLERRACRVGRCRELSPRVCACQGRGASPGRDLGTGFLFLEEAEPHPLPFADRLNITYPMLFKLTNKNSDE